jgi:hypothetical protein
MVFYDDLDDHAQCGWRDKTRLPASTGGICAFARRSPRSEDRRRCLANVA